MEKLVWSIFLGSLIASWGLVGIVLILLRPEAAPTFAGVLGFLFLSSLIFSGGLTLLITGIVQSVKG